MVVDRPVMMVGHHVCNIIPNHNTCDDNSQNAQKQAPIALHITVPKASATVKNILVATPTQIGQDDLIPIHLHSLTRHRRNCV
jgi:hypothetical protein